MADKLRDVVLVRRGEAREYLGVSEQVFSKLVAGGQLEPVHVVAGGRAHFKRKQVMELADKLTKGN